MIAGLVAFEDSGWRRLRPLTDTLPVPALAFGGSTMGERLAQAAGAPLVAVAARPELLAAWPGRPGPVSISPDEIVLAVAATALPGPWLDAAMAVDAPAAWRTGGDERLLAVRAPWGRLAPLLESGSGFESRAAEMNLPAAVAEARRIEYPWQLVEWNAEAIAADLEGLSGLEGEVHAAAVLLAPERIHVAEGARVDALAVLDARPGPVAIRAGAVVEAHTRVIGPCVVGEGTQLLGGVVGGSTIGPECRIAGEVEACVWQGYSNKRHHGFIGHSVIGEWVNLGALTTTSDLKNNYGPVRVWVDGVEVDSGNPKVGSLIGSHVKTGIGTLLPTGASLGVGANLFGGGRFAPKRVAPFAWWDGERDDVHELERFLATARIAMSRRGRALGAADERLLRMVFESTASERMPERPLSA